ncbi:PAS domain-containing protein [Pedobacter chitinilyticus]|uniref:histidine kinase n=1 Tax=Pedobacter chitinilyticus TaxID=2233776 RepID=A0A3S4RQF1_9SPHI|nr:PAS domain-containing protein [Pedobacter chitinilyticus]RWU07499.1 PAS domain S-box protein [Pedobacter chitinilyticus]
MFSLFRKSGAPRFENRYNISKKILWIVMLLCIAPLLSVILSIVVGKASQEVLFFNVKPNFYTSIWTTFGIAAALFTGILAMIDYTIRKELTITLFGITLFISAVLDVYYLLILNENATNTNNISEILYFIWWINRLFYSLTLLIGTAVYLKIKSKNLRLPEQKSRIIWRTAITSIIAGLTCVLIIANTSTILQRKLVLDKMVQIDLLSFLPLIFLFIWAVFYLPKFMLRFQGIFSKLLILSIAPLFLAQLFMALSTSAFDTYFNAAHYLRFISYLVPLTGIILNYIETVRNEQRIIAKLDVEVKEKQTLTANLLEREALLANAEKISKLGSWELDIRNNSYKWSDELYRIYGFEGNSFQPTHAIAQQVVVPEYSKKLSKELSNAVKNKTSFAAEYQIMQPDGAKRYVLNQGYFSGKEHKLVGTIQDITELKEATLKLRKNETLLREGEAVSHNGSWEWHSNQEYIFWSDEMFNIHGYLPHSTIVTLSSYFNFVHPEDAQELKKTFAEARKNKTSFKASYRIIRPSGEIRHVSTTAKLKEDEIGNGYAYLGNTQDVTQLKETQRKLEEKINELNVSNKDLEQFAYVASHDLQEPLRKIRAFGDRLKTRFTEQVDEEGKDYINRMQNAAERMQILIDDLLAFSKVARQTKAFETVDLNQLISKVLQDLDYTIESAHAKVSLTVNEKVEGIAPQLAQVFQNIISNSLKFTKPNTQPQIEITSQTLMGSNLPVAGAVANTSYCVIKITDNGIGFDESYAGKIFDLFQRLHSRTEYKGTGIGLAICKKIVENHSGFIFAKSIEGEGASFFIILPLKSNAAQ